MTYIKRNEQGEICALFDKFMPGLEEVSFDNPDVIAFLNRCEGDHKFRLIQSDLQLIRVLEDLIELLISKNIISITDFPQPVINKLLARQGIRKKISGAIGMEFEDES
ncbi:hypothetical protein Lbir_0703 [Legionella birminghamensis]|uniref:Tryptophan synthase subunit beta like protein n=1 Tax=Legionella birminghamensis TaxID=28083 RepID=A0A378I8W6_9GAMM|nr:hypothetical protein [Legionella birminghamensis]KTC74670.1 hypothetical protein Lbir_0703 [Legionella birminghamensis]STX31473.1 Uncharacterised protein [Legionella birminghamensis]